MKLRTPLVRWRFNNQMRRAGIAGGILVLRIGTGALIFLVHGWHKLFEASAYLRNGAAWRLVDEIAAMGVPLPGVAAVVTSAIQLVCAPLLVIGIWTRINAALLAGALAGAVAQNLLAGRDPQLALLYTLNATALVLIGGGSYSADALVRQKSARAIPA
jgi:uncharacterized membrane protein YphA (DoxX/SURF4 family)